MTPQSLLEYIKLRGCVTTGEVAKLYGVGSKVVLGWLRGLEERGLVKLHRVATTTWWCVDGTSPGLYRRKRPERQVVERLDAVAKMVEERGCVATSMLMRELGASHSNVLYVLRLLQMQGRVVEKLIGRTSIWCKDEAAAEVVMTQLKKTIHRLVAENRMRYATPTRVLQVALRDREAYRLLSLFVPLSHNKRFMPAALALVDAVLRMLYGEPIKYSRKHVYVVTQGI